MLMEAKLISLWLPLLGDDSRQVDFSNGSKNIARESEKISFSLDLRVLTRSLELLCACALSGGGCEMLLVTSGADGAMICQ